MASNDLSSSSMLHLDGNSWKKDIKVNQGSCALNIPRSSDEIKNAVAFPPKPEPKRKTPDYPPVKKPVPPPEPEEPEIEKDDEKKQRKRKNPKEKPMCCIL